MQVDFPLMQRLGEYSTQELQASIMVSWTQALVFSAIFMAQPLCMWSKVIHCHTCTLTRKMEEDGKG